MTIADTPAERYGELVFSPDHDTESERLEALAAAFDPFSRHHLGALGIQPGWHCLDLGSGSGTMARWLAEQVGPAGTVTAIDRDTRFVRRHPHPGLTIRQADVTAIDLEPGGFDLIHSRMMLMHVREREQLLRRMVGWLRPGGVLLVSDTANIGAESSSHEAYRTSMLAIAGLLARTISTDSHHGRRYPGLLTASGLSRVRLAVDMPVFTAGSPLARFWELTFRQSAARMIEYGLVEAATLEAALRYLRDPDTQELSFALCTASGYRES